MLFVGEEHHSPNQVTFKRSEPIQASIREADSARQVDSSGRALVEDIGKLNTLFKKVAGRITPAVAYIQVRSGSSDIPSDWFRQFEDEDTRQFFREQQPHRSVGSGVVISQEGYVVTNQHVVEGASEILVTLADKREFEASVVGSDPSTDIALIKIEGNNLPVAAVGDSDQLEVGEWVLAVGNPFRLTSTVTAGIVSALGRQVDIIQDKMRIENFIQTDAAINPGNSGGALVNLEGELVGISTAIATDNGTNAGYGFAVPSNLMERVVRDLIAYGEVQRGFLGVGIHEVNARTAQEIGLEHIAGVYIDAVRRGGAADQAGLQQGDVVLAVGNQRVNEPNELQSAIAQHHPGDQVSLEVWRGGQRKRYEVELMGEDTPAVENWFSELEPDPAPQPESQKKPSPSRESLFELGEWGIGLQEVTDREQDAFGVEDGVYLAYVESGSAAAVAGLPRDVVVQQVAGQSVSTIDEVLSVLGQIPDQKSVLWRVKHRNGITAFYEVKQPHN